MPSLKDVFDAQEIRQTTQNGSKHDCYRYQKMQLWFLGGNHWHPSKGTSDLGAEIDLAIWIVDKIELTET